MRSCHLQTAVDTEIKCAVFAAKVVIKTLFENERASWFLKRGKRVNIAHFYMCKVFRACWVYKVHGA